MFIKEFLFFISSLFLGILHSLEPGHGKSLITTYILSKEKSKIHEIAIISIIATITHTIIFFSICFIGVKFLNFNDLDKNEICTKIFSSVVILLIGIWLLWDRVFHTLLHHHHHHEDGCLHEKLQKKFHATSVLGIGVVAGLTPCPAGLAVVMASIANGENLLNSFLFILSFSLGLGITLILVAITVLYGKTMLSKVCDKSLKSLEKVSSALSAILIYSFGLFLFAYNIAPFLHERFSNMHIHCGCTHEHKIPHNDKD